MPYTYYQRADGTVCRLKGEATRANLNAAVASSVNTDDPKEIRDTLKHLASKLNFTDGAMHRITDELWSKIQTVCSSVGFLAEIPSGLESNAIHEAWGLVLRRQSLIAATRAAQDTLEQQWLDERTARLESEEQERVRRAAEATETQRATLRRRKKRSTVSRRTPP